MFGTAFYYLLPESHDEFLRLCVQPFVALLFDRFTARRNFFVRTRSSSMELRRKTVRENYVQVVQGRSSKTRV